MSRAVDVLDAASTLADPTTPAGSDARRASVDEGALSPAMAARAWALACARYEPAAVGALRGASLAGRRVGVVLAATVPTAPLRAIALPWLAGAREVLVRPSRRQRALAGAVVRAFGRDAIACVDALPEAVDHVVAYGSDETIEALRASLREGVSFEGRGHGFGVSYVDEVTDAHARAVALDVALYDQRGCLSPQGVFVRGDPVDFARRLHDALGALEATLPRGIVDLADAAAIVQWQGVAAARSAWFRKGPTHAVGALDERALLGSPGLRNVAVARVADAREVASTLGAQGRHVSAVGVAGDVDPRAWAWVPGRVVPAGAMQDPALDGPEDARPPQGAARRR